MKIIVLTSLVLLTCFHIPAQNRVSDTSATCIAFWKNQERKTILITKRTERNKDPRNTITFSLEAAITILDSSASGYRVQWIYRVPAELKKNNPALAYALSTYEGMKIEYTTSETGVFRDLKNWEEVRDVYIRMMATALPDKMDSATLAAVEKTKQLFNSKEMVEGSLIKDVQLYHMPYGNEFTTKELKVKTTITTPIITDPLPAIQTYQVVAIDKKSNNFELLIRQDIDSAGAQVILEAMLRKLNIGSAEADLKAKETLSAFEMADITQFNFIISSGWIKAVESTRIAKSAGFQKSEFCSIKLKDE